MPPGRRHALAGPISAEIWPLPAVFRCAERSLDDGGNACYIPRTQRRQAMTASATATEFVPGDHVCGFYYGEYERDAMLLPLSLIHI